MNRSFFAGLFLLSAFAFAQAPDSRFSAGGYYRISARPDFAALAAAIWPAYVAVVKSDAMQKRLGALFAEYFAEFP